MLCQDNNLCKNSFVIFRIYRYIYIYIFRIRIVFNNCKVLFTSSFTLNWFHI